VASSCRASAKHGAEDGEGVGVWDGFLHFFVDMVLYDMERPLVRMK
jgi:hypothetical protein